MLDMNELMLDDLVVVPGGCKVYVVLEFHKNGETRILGIYWDKEMAENHVTNLCHKHGHSRSNYGIITKRIRP